MHLFRIWTTSDTAIIQIYVVFPSKGKGCVGYEKAWEMSKEISGLMGLPEDLGHRRGNP